MKTQKPAGTTNLPAVAFVVANGYDLPRLTLMHPRRFTKEFDAPGAAKLLDDYFAGSKVCARQFYRALLNLRELFNAQPVAQ